MNRVALVAVLCAVGLLLLAVSWSSRDELPAPAPGPTQPRTAATPGNAPGHAAGRPAPDRPHDPPTRTAAARPLLRVLDSDGRPTVARLCWRTADRLEPVYCGTDGTPVPTTWSEVAVRKENWLPVRFGPDAVRRSGDSNGDRELVHVQLPPPVLVADVVAPTDRLAEVQLRLQVSGTPFTGWDDLDAATLPAAAIDHQPAFSARQLPLDCRGGHLEIGGLTSNSIVLDNAGELLFRRPDGHVLETWQSPLPNLTARIELAGAPVLRVTPVLVDGALPRTPRLHVEQFEKGGRSIDVVDVPARLGVTEVIPLVGGARRVDARVVGRGTTMADEGPVLVAAAKRVILRGGDEDLRLEIGRGRLRVTVQNESGMPVAGAMLAVWNDLLGVTDERGEAWIQPAFAGSVEVVAKGYDYAEVTPAELQRDPVITLRTATGLVIDGRAAARALPGCQVELRGEFQPATSSALREHYLGLWCSDPSSGTASSWSGFGVGGNEDDVVIAPRGSTYSQSFELAADRELELIGMLRPSSTVHLKVQDGSGADTGIELSVQLQPGRRTRAELPTPTVKRFVGQVVSLSNGARLDGATYKTSGWWPMLRETKVADSTLDLQLAANSELTLLHPTHLPRTWQEPEPDGLYRLEPARTLQLRVVDAAGADVPVTEARCSDAQGREYSVGCSPTAAPSIERVPLGALTLVLTSDGISRAFDVPANVREWTAVWR